MIGTSHGHLLAYGKTHKDTRPAVDLVKLRAELCRRNFSFFVKEFWSEVVPEELVWNWHMDVLCDELQAMVLQVVGDVIKDRFHRVCKRKRKPKLHDLIVNIPPGTSKSLIATVMLHPWAWSIDPSLRFITGSYSSTLSEEHADLSRDIIKSARYQAYFNDVRIRNDKDVKSNYMNTKRGTRVTTSTGGTITGFHAHFQIIDDPLNPKQAASDQELRTANRWMEHTLSTRKVNKEVTPMALIMQRLHEKDPSGVLLEKAKAGTKNIRHIKLPGEIFKGASYEKNGETVHRVQPPELAGMYVDGMLDPKRMSKTTLREMEADLGQYGYAGQIGQEPAPPEGGMFKVAKLRVIDDIPAVNIEEIVRYWDNAGTDAKDNPGAAHTAGVKIARLDPKNPYGALYLVMDVVRGQWESEERESMKLLTAQLDGPNVKIYVEQEPGSSGKDVAKATVKGLTGFAIYPERATGDKVRRADPFSVQVNWGNVLLLKGPWNLEYIGEMASFPFGKWKDQIDASSGAFNKVHIGTKKAGVW